MDLMHAKAEFEAGRQSGAAAEPSEQGDGWHLLLHTEAGETLTLTDHSGRERLYHSLDHVTEKVGELDARGSHFYCVRLADWEW